MGFIGYYRRFIQDFAGLLEPLVALTRKGVLFAWTDRQQVAFDTLPDECSHIGLSYGRFTLDMAASLFAVGGGCSTRRIGRS